MVKVFLKQTVACAAMALAALSLEAPAQAGMTPLSAPVSLDFASGAILGGPLAQRGVYVAPPRPVYYGPVAYGPPPWTPGWYDYCARRYPGFNPQTGYFVGPDGAPYFCR
jgi:hypothetical protein